MPEASFSASRDMPSWVALGALSTQTILKKKRKKKKRLTGGNRENHGHEPSPPHNPERSIEECDLTSSHDCGQDRGVASEPVDAVDGGPTTGTFLHEAIAEDSLVCRDPSRLASCPTPDPEQHLRWLGPPGREGVPEKTRSLVERGREAETVRSPVLPDVTMLKPSVLDLKKHIYVQGSKKRKETGGWER